MVPKRKKIFLDLSVSLGHLSETRSAMKILIVLSVLLCPGHFLLVSYDPKEGTTRREEKPPEKMMLSLPSEKCEELSRGGKSEGEACTEHCKGLKKEFSGGECAQGICRCQIDIDDLIQSIVGNSRGTRIMKKEKKTEKGVKCRNLIRLGGQVGSDNHKGCGVHCRLLSPQNKGGHCVDGICRCTKEAFETRAIKPPEKSYGDEEEDKEVETEEENEEQEQEGIEKKVIEQEKDDYCENDKMCLSFCRGMNKKNGRCLENSCICSNAPRRAPDLKISDSINRLIKKCEHKRKWKNEEICKAHCNSFSRDHTEGQCLDGVCHCGYAVFEMEEKEYEEGIKKNIETTGRTKKHRRDRSQY